MTLPIKSIEVVNVAPADVIVIETDDILTQHETSEIKSHLSQVWPNRQIVVLSRGFRMRVMREEDCDKAT